MYFFFKKLNIVEDQFQLESYCFAEIRMSADEWLVNVIAQGKRKMLGR